MARGTGDSLKMPTNQALQVFYGSLPLIFLIAAAFFRQQSLAKRDTLLLKSILDRLTAIEARLTNIEKDISKIKERVVVLETRAGVIYHE